MKKVVSLVCILVMLTCMLGSFAVGAASSVDGFQVSGTKLLDAYGNEFVMRGVNHAHTWYKNDLATTIPALAKAGCNSVRIVLSNGEQWTKDSASEVSNIISLCEKNKLITILEVHDATGYDDEASLLAAANYFAEIKSALVGKENTVIINIANEWGGKWDSAAWESGYKKAIPIIRDAGLTHTILVDSTGWGQYGTCVAERGKEVFNADTLKNTMFAVHMYGYAGKDEATIKSMIDGANSQGLAICVGEFGWNHSDGDVDEAAIMRYCNEKNVGWLAWSWKGNGGGVEYLDMAYDWSGNSLSEWGDTVVNGSNGLKQTSEICSVFTGVIPTSQPTSTPTLTPTPTATSSSTPDSGMRDISAIDLVKEMKIGWNLGNTLDAPTETGWGNPRTTKAMIDKVKEMGFNGVRIPVTWDTHIGSAPSYTINETWLNRVEEIVNYALDNDVYVILNVHHDNTWLIPTYANEAQSKEKLTKLWEQIANRFSDYSDYLVFETMNEPRVIGSSSEWTGGTYENRDVINNFNLAVVNTIRASGGNNAKRFIMVPTNAATSMDVALNDLIIPNNDDRVIVSIHAYSPYFFAMDVNGTSYWGSDYDKTSLTNELDAIYNRFVKNGRAVVIGEFGTIDKNNLSSRVAHAEHYAKEAAARGIAVFWWDNGYYYPGEAETYAILNRSALTWYYPEIAQALIRGAGGNPSNTPVPTPTQSAKPTPSPSSTAQSSVLYGDLNEDGRVNSTDLTMLKRYLLQIINVFPGPNGSTAADVNADGKINSTDLTIMKRYLLQIIDKFPAEGTPSVTPTPNENNPGILYNGRFDFTDSQGAKCAWSGSNVELNFYGTEASVTIKSSGENWFQAIVDGNPLPPFSVNSTTSTVELVSGLTQGNHSLVLWKRTEASQGEAQFRGFDFGSGKLLSAPNPKERKIEFIGDSITCAYGNEGTSKEQPFTPKNENSYMSYAAITARNLNASSNIIAWSGIGLAMNYGGAAGPLMLDRYPYTLPYSGVTWDYSKYVPQVVVINLGTNDFSTTPADKTEFVTAYKTLINQIRTNYPDAHVFCAVGPMLWGTGLDSCCSYITEVINDFNSKGDSKIYFVEFPQQNGSNGYGEDWHPSLATHQLMADQLTEEIKSKLGW